MAKQELRAQEIVPVFDKLQLFVDRYLIERLDNVRLDVKAPRPLPLPLPLPRNPLPISYTTVIREGNRFRAYYRDYLPGYSGPLDDGNSGEIRCYAESADGNEWCFPELGMKGPKSRSGQNVILVDFAPFSHNFSPFLDACPSVGAELRYKALAGTRSGRGLYAFGSGGVIQWRKIQDNPVIVLRDPPFDSQNVAFWSEVEACYVCYFRTWKTPHGRLRRIGRTTSKDFLHWSKPTPTNPNLPGEHLYRRQVHPYFRAPHIYISLPTRFLPRRGESTDIQTILEHL